MPERWSNLSELEADLLAAGCHAGSFALGDPRDRPLDDVFRLAERDGTWAIAYVERGQDQSPMFESVDRDTAWRWFYDHLTGLVHLHLAGRFHAAGDAKRFERRLHRLGLKTVRNDLPASVLPGGRRFRVFVTGRDVFVAREAYGELPVEG